MGDRDFVFRIGDFDLELLLLRLRTGDLELPLLWLPRLGDLDWLLPPRLLLLFRRESLRLLPLVFPPFWLLVGVPPAEADGSVIVAAATGETVTPLLAAAWIAEIGWATRTNVSQYNLSVVLLQLLLLVLPC